MEFIKNKNLIFLKFNNKDIKYKNKCIKIDYQNKKEEIDIEEIDGILLNLLDFEEIKQIYNYQYRNNMI